MRSAGALRNRFRGERAPVFPPFIAAAFPPLLPELRPQLFPQLFLYSRALHRFHRGVSSHHRWLREEIGRWQVDGLVDAGLAERLLARYPVEAERGWGRIAFSAIGATLVGLGVILFFAYNWQDLPKAGKLAIVFVALLTAHGSAIVLARRDAPNRGLVDGLHALGTMLFGAGIWLIAQIYHIDEHYPNAFFVWSLGALALAWAMPSIVQGLLSAFLVTFWAGTESFQFHSPMFAAPLLVGAGVLPLAWWRRSPMLLFFGLLVLFAVTAFAVIGVNDASPLVVLFMLAVAACVASAAAPLTHFPAAEGPLRRVGLLVAFGCGYAFSFANVARGLGHVHFSDGRIAVYLWAAALAVAGAVAAVVVLAARHGWDRIDRFRRWQIVLLGATLALVLGCMLGRVETDGWALALPFNVFVLGLATLLILEGSTNLQPWRVGGGCVVFALVTMSRYADLFTSLLARSAVFVALGAGLFVVGNYYSRQRRQVREARR